MKCSKANYNIYVLKTLISPRGGRGVIVFEWEGLALIRGAGCRGGGGIGVFREP